MAAPDDNEKPAQQMGRRARKALATRNAVFEAGLTAFENRPVGVVSVLDITEASDVAKGVFYIHYRGKDEFLIALWEFVQRTLLDAIRQSSRLFARVGHGSRPRFIITRE